MNLSADGRYAVAAYSDGTIRWHDMQTGKEILALYVHPDQRWIAWTPEDFFDAASGAESLVGYEISFGEKQPNEFVTIGQHAKNLQRPNYIAQILSASQDESKGQRILLEVAARLIFGKDSPIGKVFVAYMIAAHERMPAVKLLDIQPTRKPGEYELKLSVDYRKGQPGKLLLSVDDGPPSEISGRRPGSLGGFDTVFVKLPPGPHNVRLTASDAIGTSSAPDDPAAVRRVDVPAYEATPRLFMLAVGIHDYQDPTLNPGVAYAAADALAVAERFREQGAKFYDQVVVRELRDSQATGPAIREAMAALAAQADINDVFVLYLAGHGFADNDEYHFVPWDDVKTGEQEFRKRSLDETTLVDMLRQIKANKSLVLLDSCASGAFNLGRGGGEKDAVGRWAKLSGRAIIAATDSMANPAREGDAVQGHGHFTYALLEGLKGAADRGPEPNGTIEVSELADYIQDRLPKIAEQHGQRQFPYQELLQHSFTILPKP